MLIDGKVGITGEEGAYLVVLESGKLSARGLMLVSGITLITKESPTGVLAFVQEADGGAPVPGATVLARDARGKVHEATTGRDGTVRLDFANAKGGAGVLAARGASIAYDGFGRRIKKTSGGTTVLYHYDLNGNLISESAPDGTVRGACPLGGPHRTSVPGCRTRTPPLLAHSPPRPPP